MVFHTPPFTPLAPLLLRCALFCSLSVPQTPSLSLTFLLPNNQHLLCARHYSKCIQMFSLWILIAISGIGAIIIHLFEPTKGLVSIQDHKFVSATWVFRRVLKSGKNNSVENEPVCLPGAARYRQVAARAGKHFGKQHLSIFLKKFSRRKDYKIN